MAIMDTKMGIIYLLVINLIIGLLWTESGMALQLHSSAFSADGTIPPQYTCDGKNVSPPLSWTEIPSGTKSLVLIMDDPDAPVGTWDHWIIYNIPPTITSLEENLQVLPQGVFAGKNSWQKVTYGGPCPPNNEHRYVFKLYAIDTFLSVNGLTKTEIENAIKNHVLGSTELVAKYQRPK